MKKMILISVVFIICLVAPVHSAFAYGGGNGGGGADSSPSGLRDANEPPAGFQSSEVPMGVDPTKNIRATGKVTLTPASDKKSSYEVYEAALQDGDTIVAGKDGATITWPNGTRINIKPNTKIQIIQNLKLPHPDAFRIHMGNTWIRLRYNERTKGFQALTPNAGAPRG